MTTVAERIKAILEKLSYSQHDLAAKLNVKQPSVSVWLSGGNLRASTVDYLLNV